MRRGDYLCGACKKDLYEYDPSYPGVEPHIAYNSLNVVLGGGYGLFFDTDWETHTDTHDMWLCHDCAHKMVHAVPFLNRLLEGGHFHGFIHDDDEYGHTDFHHNWGVLA